jgi:hypothetical protein
MSLVEAQAPGQGTDELFDEDTSCAKEQLVFSFPLAGLSKAISFGRQPVVRGPCQFGSMESRNASKSANASALPIRSLVAL